MISDVQLTEILFFIDWYERKGKEELEKERSWNEFKEVHTWSISGDELGNASVELGLSPLHNLDGNPSLSVSDLKKCVMDVYCI